MAKIQALARSTWSLSATQTTANADRFPEGTVFDKIRAHSEQAPAPLSTLRSDVPAEVEAILFKMLAKDRSERYQTPAEVAQALAGRKIPITDTQQPPQSVRTRIKRRLLVGSAFAFLAAMVAAIVFYIQTDNGVVRVEVADPTLQVTLNGKTIEMKDGEVPLEIALAQSGYGRPYHPTAAATSFPFSASLSA